MTYYEVLDVPQTASQSEIYKRYMKLMREHHPDRFSDPARRAEAEKYVQAINEAFNTLRDSAARAKYDQGLQQEVERKPPEEEARVYFGRGQTAERVKDFHTAIECYRRACALDGKAGKYPYHLARLQESNAKWRRDTVENYQKAVALEPKNVEYYKAFISFYQQQGMNIRAQKLAQKALALAPQDTELQSIAQGPEAPQERGFITGAWFRKPKDK